MYEPQIPASSTRNTLALPLRPSVAWPQPGTVIEPVASTSRDTIGWSPRSSGADDVTTGEVASNDVISNPVGPAGAPGTASAQPRLIAASRDATLRTSS